MLLCFLFVIYITWVCNGWGQMACRLFYKAGFAYPHKEQHLWLYPITGLCIICFAATVFSLFIPLGGWPVQAGLAIPPLLGSFRNRPFYNSLKAALSLKWYFLLLFFSCLVLILTMHAWQITHPDTLGYHAEAIAWINQYKAVPGLVHINDRLGLGSGWFILCSVFSFSFLHLQALTFINASVLVWLAAFTIQQTAFFMRRKSWYAFPYLLLLSFALCCYTQLRLTATSASPDYIANLLILAVLYLALARVCSSYHLLLISITAVCVKLSAIPVLLIPVGIFFLENGPKPRLRKCLFFLLSGSILLLPFITRNTITSGYVFYPQPGLQAGPSKNALPAGFVRLQRDYIKAYARIPLDADEKQVAAVLDMPLQKWIPVWWSNRSPVDKVILLLASLSLLMLCLYPVKLFKHLNSRTAVCLICMLTGCIFWAVTAPDPRFGNGYLLGFSGIVWSLYIKYRKYNTGLSNAVISFVLTALITGVICYTLYRFKNFSSPGSLLAPMGTGEQIRLKLPV